MTRVVTYDYGRPEPGLPRACRGRCASGRPCAMPCSVPFACSPCPSRFEQIYAGAGVPNVVTIANGVQPLEARPKRPAPDERVRLAHIGGTDRHKGLHLVREALRSRRFSNLHVTVVELAFPRGVVEEEVWGTTPVTRRAPRFTRTRWSSSTPRSTSFSLRPSGRKALALSPARRCSRDAGWSPPTAARWAPTCSRASTATSWTSPPYLPFADILARIDAAPRALPRGPDGRRRLARLCGAGAGAGGAVSVDHRRSVTIATTGGTACARGRWTVRRAAPPHLSPRTGQRSY